ncbi:MAG: ferritin [Chitinophagales bacterium]
MLDKKIEEILNRQIAIEGQASYKYLALASWCDNKGFAGAARFLFEHSDEERMHMMKLLNYVIDKGGKVVVPAVEQPRSDFKNIKEVFEYAYTGEQSVTAAINEIVSLSLKLNDHTTNNFIQWYVNEQLEEENLYRQILDRIELIGEGGNALYLIDLEIDKLSYGAGGMAAIPE